MGDKMWWSGLHWLSLEVYNAKYSEKCPKVMGFPEVRMDWF